MATSAARGSKAKADRLASRIVRARGYCQRCGTERGPFDCAHIIGRRYSGTRTDERNLWCLCKQCHYVVDNFHDQKAELVEKTIGPLVYSSLVVKAREGVGMKYPANFWADEVVRLMAVAV